MTHDESVLHLRDKIYKEVDRLLDDLYQRLEVIKEDKKPTLKETGRLLSIQCTLTQLIHEDLNVEKGL